MSAGMVEGILAEVDDTLGNKSGRSAFIVAIKLETYHVKN